MGTEPHKVEAFEISPRGAWLCKDAARYHFDEPLAKALVELFKKEKAESILDLGCGAGKYVDFLASELDSRTYIVGIDGNPNTPRFSQRCFVGDLSKPVGVGRVGKPPGRFHWVMSLETGEHIPKKYEVAFLNNLTANAACGVVLSWFPVHGHGVGHVNPRTNKWVKKQMAKRGFQPMDDVAQKLREVSEHWWFKSSIMVFKRRPK